MIDLILNKILYVIFFLSCVNVIRHSLLFVINVSDQKKYQVSDITLFYLGLSISMILTSIVTGIKL